MKAGSVILYLLILQLPIHLMGQTGTRGGPFEWNDSVYNFGPMEVGEEVEYYFWVSNKDKEQTHSIVDIQFQCEGLRVIRSHKNIDPKDVAYLLVTYKATKPLVLNEIITIKTEDPDHTYKLKIMGTVHP